MSSKMIDYTVYVNDYVFTRGALNPCLLLGAERVNKPLRMAATTARGIDGVSADMVKVVLDVNLVKLDSGLCNRALQAAQALDLPIVYGDTISNRLFNLLNRFTVSSVSADVVLSEYNFDVVENEVL